MNTTILNGRYEIIRQLDEGGISKVFLGYDHVLHNELVIRVLKKEILSNYIEDIIRFRNEAAILSRMDHPNIVKTYDTFEYEGEHYIIMEYISGESLYKLIKNGKKLEEKTIIEIMIQVCEALDYMHKQNIIHRDLKPGNIMIYPDKKGRYYIKVIDFGLAFIKEFTAVKDSEEIAGTFCYMSPEHFRVINRSVDERSDLYSLGIIMYQLVSGVLPFEGKSTGSIMHHQIAMPPVAPRKHKVSLSDTLDKIILKLMEKEPEKRYQSAMGLKRDLEKYRNGERDFPLGMNDKQVRLSFMTGLLSREKELDDLKACYNKILKGQGTVCFIAGEAGKGKTRLAQELRSYVYREGGVFIDAKCFSSRSKTPYGAFKDALSIYLKKYRDYPRDRKKEIRDRLTRMTGELGRIILQLNPAADVIFNKCPELVKLETEREKRRFLMVAGRFFLDLSMIEKRLVLLIDDLQWADDGSMDLLYEISSELQKYPLFIIGTYRNDEIEQEHRINQYKKTAAERRYPYSEICLGAFNQEAMDEYVKALLSTKDGDIGSISEVIYRKSKGNPFFALEILKQFLDEKVINYSEGTWKIDRERLKGAKIASTIVEIVMKRISLLNREEVKVLSYAAIIGRKFKVEVLFGLLDYKAETIIGIVDRAIQLQFLEEDIQEKGKILFAHDSIKEAFYLKCGEAERKKLHRQIMEAMERTGWDDRDEVIFELARHAIEGDEQEKILKYAFPAGIRAKEHYAYEDALRYLKIVHNIIEQKEGKGGKLWIDTNKNISEIYLVIGRNDEAIERSQTILPFLESKIQKADIYKQITIAYLKKGDWQNCEEYGKQGLALLGEKLSVGKIAARIRVLKEFIVHITHTISPIIFIRKKSKKNNAKYKLILSFYMSMNWMYILSNTLKFIGSTLRLLNLSESKIGDSVERGVGLAGYASICMSIPLFKHAEHLHAKALRLWTKLHEEWGTAQSLQFLGFCHQWKGEYGKSIKYFFESLHIFKKIGDLWEIKMSLSGLDMSYFHVSDYNRNKQYFNQRMKLSEKLNDNFGKGSSLAVSALTKYRQGDYDLALKHTKRLLAIAEDNKLILSNCVGHILMGIIYIELGEYKRSIKYLKKACYLRENYNLLEFYTVFVYTCLAEAYIRDVIDSNRDKVNVNKKEMIKTKRMCAKALMKSKPWKIHYAYALYVNAMYYALISRNKKAERLFLYAIDLSRTTNFRYELAMSLYEYGMFLRERGRTEQANKNLESAYTVFKEIDSKIYLGKTAELLGIQDPEEKEGIASIQRLKHQERLASIIQVGRKISSILNLELLLRHILSLAMEITGAHRGYLFIKDEEKDELVLKIKKSIDHNKNSVPAKEGVEEQYSMNIVETVSRGRKVVLTNDAEKDLDFGRYRSVVQYRLKSILCVPIKHRNRIIGVCYLDNPLSAAVFSRDDIDVLEAMMAQAAISIENARLYEKMKLMKDKAESEVENLTVHISKKREKLLDGKDSLVYQSREIQEVVDKVNQAVVVGKPVLITGETGTGKELIAKLIHCSGKYKQEPFVTINCAAVPHTLWEAELFGYIKGAFTDAKTNREGSIAEAGKGTLFLDEIGEMPPEIQSKLLRLLQENQYRPIGSNKTSTSACRFVFSTNRDVEEMVKKGSFREDLYYRINVFRIHITPLRQRKDDIPILLEYFIKKYSPEFDLPPDIEVEKQAVQRILDYRWPGNIREMENFVIRALAVLSSSDGDGKVLRLTHFPAGRDSSVNKDTEKIPDTDIKRDEAIIVDGNYDEMINRYAVELIRRALRKAEGNKTIAAKILGIKRTTLNYKIKELSIE